MEEITPKEFEMRLSQTAAEYLKESARWSFFLSIIGFIGIGFMMLAAVFVTFLSSLTNSAFGSSEANVLGPMQGMLSGMYVLLALLYFFPVYYLFKYAKGTKEALLLHDSDALEAALGYLKSHHKFVGIMMIVILSIYVVALFGIIVAAAAFGH